MSIHRVAFLYSALLGLILGAGVVLAVPGAPNQPQTADKPADSLLIGTPNEDLHGVTDAGAMILVPGMTGNGLVTATASLWTQDNSPDKSEAYDRFSAAMVSGDFNGDGWPDVAVGVPSEDYEVTVIVWVEDVGAVQVIYGNADGPDTDHQQFFTQNNTGVETNEADDAFGYALAAGDFNGDGYDDLAIGVPDEDKETESGVITNTGAVLAVYGSPSGLLLTSTQQLDNLYPETDAHAGRSLAAGDFDGDGYDDLVVGAPGASANGVSDAGAIDVWYGRSVSLGDPIRWHDGNPEPSDEFGHTLTTGDFNGDGYEDAAVGAPLEDVGTQADDAGAVTIIYGSSVNGLGSEGAQLWYQDVITDSQGDPIDPSEENDNFGHALAAGDFNGDGYDDLVIGAPGEGTSALAPNRGAVQTLNGTAGGLTANNSRIWYGTFGNYYLGTALTAGDFNRDGYDDFAAGMPGENVYANGVIQSEAGGVNVYYSDGTLPDVYPPAVVHIDSTDIPGTAAEIGDLFGDTLATLPAPSAHVYLPLIQR